MERETSSWAVEDVVFDVRVLGSGTFSPGARCTGLPMPEVAGIGFTLKSEISLAGVTGKLPGRSDEPVLTPRDGSLGTFPARFAVVDWGVTPDIIAAVGSLEEDFGLVMRSGVSTLFMLLAPSFS